MSAQPEIVISALPVNVITPSSSDYVQLFFNKSDADRLYGKRSDGTIFLIQGVSGAGVSNVTATLPITSSGGANPDISTQINTARLVGRTSAGVGVMHEIVLGTNLAFSGNTLNASSPVPDLEQVMSAGSNVDAVGVINDNSGLSSIEVNSRRLTSDTLDNYIDWSNGDIFIGPGAVTQVANLYDSHLFGNWVVDEVTTQELIDSNKTINIIAGDSAVINSISGRFRKDITGTSFVLTNSFISVNSIVLLQVVTPGLTTGGFPVPVAGAGICTITFQNNDGSAVAPNIDADVNFFVIN